MQLSASLVRPFAPWTQEADRSAIVTPKGK